jgi:hypothetical protein
VIPLEACVNCRRGQHERCILCGAVQPQFEAHDHGGLRHEHFTYGAHDHRLLEHDRERVEGR